MKDRKKAGVSRSEIALRPVLPTIHNRNPMNRPRLALENCCPVFGSERIVAERRAELLQRDAGPQAFFAVLTRPSGTAVRTARVQGRLRIARNSPLVYGRRVGRKSPVRSV